MLKRLLLCAALIAVAVAAPAAGAGAAAGAQLLGLGSGYGLFIVGAVASFDYILVHQSAMGIRAEYAVAGTQFVHVYGQSAP
ncbi:MAG TPA: hypothetical protein VFG21_03965 [Xanthomonadaceae bacterium]|nr:hypothetical protein [Xanthomonadaceae bacterium]